MTLGGTFHYSGLEPNYVDVCGKDGYCMREKQ